MEKGCSGCFNDSRVASDHMCSAREVLKYIPPKCIGCSEQSLREEDHSCESLKKENSMSTKDIRTVFKDGQDLQPELPIGLVKVNNDNWSPQYTIIDSFSCRRVEPAYYYTGEAPYYPTATIIGCHYDGAYIKPVVSKELPVQSFEHRLAFLAEKANSGKGDSDRHLLTLFSIALSSHARNILELGVRRGDTTLPLLMAAKLNSGIVDSVDIDNTEFECPDDLKARWNFHKSDAIAFLAACVKQGRKFDFIYLDDWHEYSHVKQELELIDRLVSPKGIVLIHDLMYGGTEPFYHSDLTDSAGKQWAKGGPYRAVAELPGQFWEFSTLPYNNGLTLLRKKYSSKYFNN